MEAVRAWSRFRVFVYFLGLNHVAAGSVVLRQLTLYPYVHLAHIAI